ncbi:MAG: hypothetical protein VZT48_12785 [Bulleidia sp.]|nr:hypothetical protein [Bulleidia sp.]
MKEDKVPEGFTLAMALLDAVPVVFFCFSVLVCASVLKDQLFLIGSVLVITAGLLKVCWKFVIAVSRKNIMFLNRQMRYLMPLGFVLIIVSLCRITDKVSLVAFTHAMTGSHAWIFFFLGLIGIGFMVYFAKHNDQMDARSNWKEQFTNALSQLAFLIGFLLCRTLL